MSREIIISPVTRIEGHAKITIHLDEEGMVKDARFHVTDFRGFEKFCEGRPFYEMPGITSRICGICPVSHLLASAKACDDLLAVKIPRTAELLRRLMHMGQIIQSHALSFFYLSSPDFLLGLDSEPSKRNILGLAEKYPEIAKQGVWLRKFGQSIIETLSGRRIHSSDWIVPGGVKTPLSKEGVDKILADVPKAIEIALNSIELFNKNMENFKNEMRDFGDFQTYYMSLVTKDGGLEHYDGNIRILSPEGKVVADQLDPSKYFEYIGEAVEDWSYMKFPYLKNVGYPDGAYRVGPLARLNNASHCGTEMADNLLKEFKKLGKNGVVQNTFMYHYARLIEIVFCIEKVKELLQDPEILSTEVQAKASLNKREGVGVIEAPRGTLFHHYKVDEQGRITWVNLIIATVNNNIAFNKAVAQVAKKYVNGKKLNEGMLNKVEAVVRALDPCLSCATHAIGRMPVRIQLYDHNGSLIDEIARG
ncbi:MAG: Ni/Fe hydrogenase subunit alpha [Thermoproteota archaeon]|nr:Ni/Fe hydrogenase subunit alpha [Candidatus Brockarchaeota archaeon]